MRVSFAYTKKKALLARSTHLRRSVSDIDTGRPTHPDRRNSAQISAMIFRRYQGTLDVAKTLVIRNPTAGHFRVRALWPQIELALKDAGMDFDAIATEAPLQATDIARSAAQNYRAIVAIGGDGTVSEVVNGLMQHSEESETIALGIVPVGNGDDFAKMLPPEAPLGGASYDWRSGVQKVIAGQSRLYDVGRMRADEASTKSKERCHYFVNVVDVGFGAHTVQNFASVPKWILGQPAYLAAVLKTLINYPTLRMRMQFDDAPAFDQVTTIAAIGNGRCFGGGFWVCPDAHADDGCLDVMVSEKITRRTILRLLPKLQRGTHVSEAVVTMSRAKRVVLESGEPFFVEADGEMPYTPTRRLEVDILPGRLRVMV